MKQATDYSLVILAWFVAFLAGWSAMALANEAMPPTSPVTQQIQGCQPLIDEANSKIRALVGQRNSAEDQIVMMNSALDKANAELTKMRADLEEHKKVAATPPPPEEKK